MAGENPIKPQRKKIVSFYRNKCKENNYIWKNIFYEVCG